MKRLKSVPNLRKVNSQQGARLITLIGASLATCFVHANDVAVVTADLDSISMVSAHTNHVDMLPIVAPIVTVDASGTVEVENAVTEVIVTESGQTHAHTPPSQVHVVAAPKVVASKVTTTTVSDPTLVTTVDANGRIEKEAAVVAKTTTVQEPVVLVESYDVYNSVYKNQPDYYWSGKRWVYLPAN